MRNVLASALVKVSPAMSYSSCTGRRNPVYLNRFDKYNEELLFIFVFSVNKIPDNEA